MTSRKDTWLLKQILLLTPDVLCMEGQGKEYVANPERRRGEDAFQ